jgi:hypothetical protein
MESATIKSIKSSALDDENNKFARPASRRRRILATLMNFVCGIESDELNELSLEAQSKLESLRRVENFYSLHQTKAERYILNVNLVIIILIAVGLYLFFSIPPELHIFSDLYNATSHVAN